MATRSGGWRPPANATSFSFGPWVTCHCAHGVVEEPEMRIHHDEEIRPSPPPKLRMSGGLDTKVSAPMPERKSQVQLPEEAIRDREDRRSLQESKGKGAAFAPGTGERRGGAAAVPRCVFARKAAIALLALVAASGLLALAAGIPASRQLYNKLEDHTCRLGSEFRPADVGPSFKYSMFGVSCWVQLQVEEDGDWSKQRWTVMTFEHPKEFLGRFRCEAEVRRHSGDFGCSFAPSEEARLGVLAMPKERLRPWSLELLLAARYTVVLLLWLAAWPLLCCIAVGPRLQASCLRRGFKALALALLLVALAGPVWLALRYPAAKAAREELQDGTCHLGDVADTATVRWSLAPAVRCGAAKREGEDTATPLTFAFPAKWWQLRYHHLSCDQLLASYRKTSFPCAGSAGESFEGHKADLPPWLLELWLVQSRHPEAVEVWCFSAVAGPALLLLLALSSRCRREVKPEDYQRLGNA
ncbi:unnamed protein product [Effrenium voratum]|uniref:Uncharacterized protein n=1 Tax=Effrenium voratum TaxID=2562239 RepID=A0AA36IDI0_9DINO|nr:unnamed protein product [Effrenium voratum]